MKNKDFTIDGYFWKNYINLNFKEKNLVLKSRNENRKWMLNQEIIQLQDHLSWLETLKNDSSKLYFLVFLNDTPFISISFHGIDGISGYWGYFLINQNYKSEVLKIEKEIINFAFNELNLTKLLCINHADNHVIHIHKFFGFKEISKELINNQEYVKMELIR